MQRSIKPRTVALWSCFALVLLILGSCVTFTAQAGSPGPQDPGGNSTDDVQLSRHRNGSPADMAIVENGLQMIADGRRTFRFDTFGSEDFWGGQLRLHQSIATLTPRGALQLGLKIDAEALSERMLRDLRRGRVNLNDPQVTLALLRRRAVVGVTGFFTGGQLTSVGIQCALCHSNVDDAVTTGVGRRLDGWPNSDLDIGKIVASAPTLQPFVDLLGIPEAQVRTVLNSWGPGKFDAELTLDGKALNPVTGKSAATLNPPAFGLAGVNNHTWTGAWGTVTYWNAFVANLEMHGNGTFFDPRLDDAVKYPVAARARLGHKRDSKDRITPKLPALHFYQLAIPTPDAPRGAFDRTAAARGRSLFTAKARCAECHVPPIFTEPGWNLHKGEEIGIDEFQAQRAPDDRYRTTPLRALWDTQKIHKRGFYHDGRFPTLPAVIDHYDSHFGLGLTAPEKNDLAEYLKSL